MSKLNIVKHKIDDIAYLGKVSFLCAFYCSHTGHTQVWLTGTILLMSGLEKQCLVLIPKALIQAPDNLILFVPSHLILSSLDFLLLTFCVIFFFN